MSNEYDITQYSDDACYQMLDLMNPTDRELEMKILQMMDNYENKSKRLYHFFESMYDRFFGEDEDDNQDEDANRDESNVIEGFKSETAEKTPIETVKNSDGQEKTGIQEVVQVDYVADKMRLNPVERKTIFKMISIDSQFRDDPTSTLSTNFTMNLAEPIDNVISMKLYSVQIPYTWYTINSSFGSNFFYIKGNSPGINNGNHDIKVEIDSGTYRPEEIATAINTQLSFLKNKTAVKNYITSNPDDTTYNPVLDMSLGNTQVSYNLGANNAKVVFEFDLKKQYDETNYQLYFPSWSSPMDVNNKTLTIPSFLGFNYDTYYPYVAYSQMVLPLIGDVDSDTSTRFYIDASNNYFTIRHYVGTSTIREIPIYFSLQTGASYARNTLISDLNAQLLQNSLIDPTYSYVRRVNITDLSLAYNKSRIEIAVKLKRTQIDQIENSKLQIIFPNEEQLGNHIWTGTDSCFAYSEPPVFTDPRIFELNEIVSETQATLTNYVVEEDSAKIQFECVKPLYSVPENVRVATVASSLTSGYLNGYLLNDYIGAINSSLATMNDTTISVPRPNGEFNINTTNGIYNTRIGIEQDYPKLKIDILREFTQTTYIVDLSGCFLSQGAFGFDASYANLTDTNYTIAKNYSTSATITITESNNKIVLRPKTTGGPNGNGYGNQNAPPVELYFTTGQFSQIELFLQSVNNDFINFVDSDNYLLTTGCALSFANGQLTLVLRVSKILTESEYKLTFIDVNNTWSNNLKFDSSYNLVNYITGFYAEIVGNDIVQGDLINLNALKNTIIFKPYVEGVANGSGLNDIIISLPVNSGSKSYTREGLIEAIQTEFDNNPLTAGSQITLITQNNLQYTKIRMNINKLYTAKDYKLVFYDATSYVYCNVGVAQNVTWDATLGWLLGFHSFTEYALGDFLQITRESISTENYRDNVFSNPSLGYAYSLNGNKIAVIGDTVLNTNLYNYFLVVLDDFIQNHVNAGLITISSLESDLALPSYAVRATYQCDPVTGVKTAVSASNKLNTNLNSKQLYAMNQIIETKRTKAKSYASGPYLKDVFALIPMKLTGMTYGQTYMEFGGTMQNQDRKYFGPVRIQKLSVKLMNDKGSVLNLNGGNWSFCIICEIMNKQ